MTSEETQADALEPSEVPESILLLHHKEGSGPWILISDWAKKEATVECMGRRGEIRRIARENFMGAPKEIPFANLSDGQRLAYCQHFQIAIPAVPDQEFRVGGQYTRKQINARLGGEQTSYLPKAKGKVVCGCFDPGQNPEAPAVILPGNTNVIVGRAETAVSPKRPIPIFLKKGPTQWEYVGLYRVMKFSRVEADYVERAKKAERVDVSGALFLEPAL